MLGTKLDVPQRTYPQESRYRLTDLGLRTGWFFARTYSRILRPGLGRILPELSAPNNPLHRWFDKLDRNDAGERGNKSSECGDHPVSDPGMDDLSRRRSKLYSWEVASPRPAARNPRRAGGNQSPAGSRNRDRALESRGRAWRVFRRPRARRVVIASSDPRSNS